MKRLFSKFSLSFRLGGFNPRRDWQIMLAVWLIVLLVVIIWRATSIPAFQTEFELVTNPDQSATTINEKTLTETADIIRVRAEQATALKKADRLLADPS